MFPVWGPKSESVTNLVTVSLPVYSNFLDLSVSCITLLTVPVSIMQITADLSGSSSVYIPVVCVVAKLEACICFVD